MKPYDVTITDGSVTKKFLLDRASEDYRYQSIPTLRPQQDSGSSPSEQSINPEIGWLRSIESFHHGQGQTYQDRAESDRYRYRTSKGVDPWTKWQLTLLPDTEQKLAFTQIEGIHTATASSSTTDYLYVANQLAQTVKFTSNVTASGVASWTAITDLGAVNQNDIASTGESVYIASNDKIRVAAAGATTSSVYATHASAIDRVGWVKGRLMAAQGPNLYNIVTSGAFPAALFTHPLSQWTWQGFTEGPHHIYALGKPYSTTATLEQGMVYRIGIKSDGTGLDAPIPAMPGLPEGEQILFIYNYVGLIFLGTTVGVRMATPDDNGDLTIGAPLSTNGKYVRGMAGSDRFVWFTWEGFDATSGGLGRMDISAVTDTLQPAYASDVMTATTANVLGCAVFQNRRLFIVAGSGLFGETSTKVSTGYLQSGYITYNISDPKTPQAVDTRHRPLPAGSSIVTALNVDDGGFVTASTLDSDSDNTRVALTGYGHSERVELQATLNRATDTSQSPTLERMTLLSEVIVQTGMYIYLPVMLSDADALRGGYTKSRNIGEELEQLITWRTERTSLTLTVGTQSYGVVLRDFRTSNHHKGRTDDEQATVLLQLKENV